MTDGWTGRRVALTGATGFAGGVLARDLAARGAAVLAIVRPESDCRRLPADAAVHVHDGDGTALARAVGAFAPDLGFHLAARQAPDGPGETADLIAANVTLGSQFLEALAGARGVVAAGSFWAHYGPAGTGAVNLYAATKQAFARILAYHAEARGLPAVELVLYDTYGPDDPRRKLFRLLREAAGSGTPLAMSPGDQIIDLVHVVDVAAAFRVAGERLLAGAETWARYTVPGPEPRPLRDVVALWQLVTGRSVPVVWGGRPHRPREVMVPWRGTPLPGWRAAIGLDEGIRDMEYQSASQ